MRLSTAMPISVTMVVAGLTLVITIRMELTRYELAIALTAIPCFAGLLATWFFLIRESLSRNRGLSSSNPASMTESQLATIWGRPLSKLQTVISLGGERIKLAQAELEETLQGGTTNIYDLIRIGYKCIQTCNAVNLLCAKGFPDQALSLCRGLMEQEANLWFISSIENKEEVTQRYLDWEKAKFFHYVRDRKDGLDKRNLGPTTVEWDTLTKEYKRLETKYRGNDRLSKREGWAIGKRANGTQLVKAFTVQERAWQSLPWLPSDETQLYDAWTSEWQRLNEFTHTTPRSIFESASSNDQNVVVMGQSPLGIDEPLVIAGRSMLNISTILTNIASSKLPKGKSRRSEDLGRKTVRTYREMLEELANIPGEAAPWHRRMRVRDELESESPQEC